MAAKMMGQAETHEVECLIGDSEGPLPPMESVSSNKESSSKRARVLSAMSIIVALILCLKSIPMSSDAGQPGNLSSHENSTFVGIEESHDDTQASQLVKEKVPSSSTSISRVKSTHTDTISSSKQATPATLQDKESDSTQKKVKKLEEEPKVFDQTCQVPYKDSKKAPKLTSSSSLSSFANCGKHMGLKMPNNRKRLVKNLPMNPQAHLFSFPPDARDSDGLRPLLCVPQKNGNKQFGGFVYAAWHKKAGKSGEQVDHDMGHWQTHHLGNTNKSHQTHVYFVARNPYTRILSMYLQKVVNACISDGQKGCNTHGWHLIKPDTPFKEFVEIIEKKLVEKGSLCAISHHLCQQVETCLTTTHYAKAVTVIRVEEESCWFPCLAKQVGIKTSVLDHGWEDFSGHSCYYTSTGDCNDMLRSIDPDKVGVVTGNVHATGASNRLAEHYDRKTAETISRLYADDFRVLGYPLWDGESKM